MNILLHKSKSQVKKISVRQYILLLYGKVRNKNQRITLLQKKKCLNNPYVKKYSVKVWRQNIKLNYNENAAS